MTPVRPNRYARRAKKRAAWAICNEIYLQAKPHIDKAIINQMIFSRSAIKVVLDDDQIVFELVYPSDQDLESLKYEVLK